MRTAALIHRESSLQLHRCRDCRLNGVCLQHGSNSTFLPPHLNVSQGVLDILKTMTDRQSLALVAAQAAHIRWPWTML